MPKQTTNNSAMLGERLSRAVDGHVQAEARTILEYERILRSCTDPEVRFLIQLVLEDEHRHHALLDRLGRALQDDTFHLDGAPALPFESEMAPLDDIASRLACVAVDERIGAEELLNLANAGKEVDGGLFSVVLRLIAFDCQKHALALAHAGERMRALQRPHAS